MAVSRAGTVTVLYEVTFIEKILQNIIEYYRIWTVVYYNYL